MIETIGIAIVIVGAALVTVGVVIQVGLWLTRPKWMGL